MFFDHIMKKHVESFLDGYSTNFMAYGQTGAGKTYTMLGPNGTF